MMRRIGHGVLAGTVLSLLSWNGNDTPHLVSTFPDAITLIAVPLLILSALWAHGRRWRLHDPSVIRRAGAVITTTAGLVFATGTAVVAVWRLDVTSPAPVVFGCSTALLSTLLLGALSTTIATPLLTRSQHASDPRA